MPLGVEHELGRVTGFIEEAEDLVVIGRLRVTRQPRPPMATRDGAEHVATPVRHQRLAAVSTVHVRVTGRHIASARRSLQASAGHLSKRARFVRSEPGGGR
jgi:hypothetical protein